MADELPVTPGSIVTAGGVMVIRGQDGQWWQTSPGYAWPDFPAWWEKNAMFRTVIYVPAAASATALVERIEAALAVSS